jgi:single-strand DNA-binding protein
MKMAGSVNRVILIGNVGRDPEVRNTQAGAKIVQFSVATSETWKDSSGQKQERTEWHRVVCFNERIGDVIEKYVRKGSSVYVEGSIQTRKWTDQSGAEKFTTEIVISKFKGELTLLGGKNDGGERQAPPAAAPAPQRPVAAPTSGQHWGGGGSGADLDDQIPFGPCWQ